MNIPLLKMYWDEEDVRMVSDSIQAGMSWAGGPNIEKFEQMLAEYVGTKYAVVFNSGTSALHAVMIIYGLGTRNEVIVPSFTFIATANAPLFVGAKPAFADIDDNYGLDPEDVERKITSNTRMIIPIHYGGSTCRIEELKYIAKRYKLALIEDACESLGAEVNGKKVGSFGDCSVLSFCSAKLITTGEGGAVLTDSHDKYECLKLVRSHGRDENTNYFATSGNLDYVGLGYNFRMSNITAALGVAQLKKIDKLIAMRRENAEKLSLRLSGVVETPQNNDVYQMYTIRVKAAWRDLLAAHLDKKGIMTKVYFPPVHLTYFYWMSMRYLIQLPNTERIAEQVLTLPMYPSLTEEEIDYIADGVISFVRSAE